MNFFIETIERGKQLLNNLITLSVADEELNETCEKCMILGNKKCPAKRFQQNFKNWTSGNNVIDKFIQDTQLSAHDFALNKVLEWIPYDRFENIEYLAEGGFGTVYKAIWIDGDIQNWDINQSKWDRYGNKEIVLKCLKDSQNLDTDFLQEVICCYLLLILYFKKMYFNFNWF